MAPIVASASARIGSSIFIASRTSTVSPFFTDCPGATRSEEHTSELQSQSNLVCRLLLEKKKICRPLPGHGLPPAPVYPHNAPVPAAKTPPVHHPATALRAVEAPHVAHAARDEAADHHVA